MQTNHLFIKHGARITAVHAVAHSTYKGVAEWYFLGDLEWPKEDGGSVQANKEIMPFAVCYMDDAGKPECDAIMKALNDYLLDKGKWHKPKPMKDGRMVSWTPKEKTGLAPL
jgi:hypothetical protein